MARPNKTGVPGLTKRPDGRYRLAYRWSVIVDGKPRTGRVVKLYKPELAVALIKSDARALVEDAQSGQLVRRQEAEKIETSKKTIAELAPVVIAARNASGLSPGTIAEFRSYVSGHAQSRRPKLGAYIVRLLGHLRPSELDSTVLATLVDQLTAAGLAPATIGNVFKALGIFLKICRTRKLDPDLKSNLLHDARELGFKLPKVARKRPLFLTTEQAVALLSSPKLPEHRRVRYLVAILAGLREGEISALVWSDISFDKMEISVTKGLAMRGGLLGTKTAAGERRVPLHPDLAAALRVFKGDAKPTAPVFVGTKSKRAVRPETAKLLRADLQAAGVEHSPKMVAHCLRKTFCAWLESAGVPHEQIERLIGHEQKSVLGQHYAGGDFEVLRGSVAKLRIPFGTRLRVVA